MSLFSRAPPCTMALLLCFLRYEYSYTKGVLNSNCGRLLFANHWSEPVCKCKAGCHCGASEIARCKLLGGKTLKDAGPLDNFSVGNCRGFHGVGFTFRLQEIP